LEDDIHHPDRSLISDLTFIRWKLEFRFSIHQPEHTSGWKMTFALRQHSVWAGMRKAGGAGAATKSRKAPNSASVTLLGFIVNGPRVGLFSHEQPCLHTRLGLQSPMGNCTPSRSPAGPLAAIPRIAPKAGSLGMPGEGRTAQSAQTKQAGAMPSVVSLRRALPTPGGQKPALAPPRRVSHQGQGGPG
jgi:hypothetical protein